MTRDEIADLMEVVYGQWPKEGSIEKNVLRLAKLWQAALADLPFGLAQRAVVKVMCSSPWFPKVSEIRRAALDLVHGQPIHWGEAYDMIREADYNPKRLAPMVSEAMDALGDTHSWRTETNQTARRAQFRDIYQAKVEQDREQKLLPQALRVELQAANEKARLPDAVDMRGARSLPGNTFQLAEGAARAIRNQIE